MNEIYNYVKNWGEDIDCLYDDNDNITHIYWSFEDNYFCVCEPHSGNDFKYLLRVNNKETFDRWNSAEVEIYTKNAEDIISELMQY